MRPLSRRPAPRPFRQLDVFGTRPGTGNPVAVVLEAEGIDDDTMRRFSAWTNLSECTFVLPPSTPDADYRVRIFSLGTELPFAGHPTLGTARAWLDAGHMPRGRGVLMQECVAGLIPVRIDGDDLAFASPVRTRSGPVDPGLRATVIDALGVDGARVVAAEWLDNGPGWMGVLLADAEAVLALRPRADRYAGPGKIGVIGFQEDEADADAAIEVRAFVFPGDGSLREDPITGSLQAAAAEWLLASGRIRVPYTAAQGRVVGRDGRVRVSADAQALWIGGRADVIVSGTVSV